MKAELKRSYTTYEGYYLFENTEIEIIKDLCTPEGYFYECVIPSGAHELIPYELLRITEYSPCVDWQQTRINAAIAIAQGLAANSSLSSNGEDYIAEKLVRLADKLVERLKGIM